MSEPTFIAGVPASLAHLSWLIGSWLGVGVGGETDGKPFQFAQEVQIGCDGREFLTHASRSWLLDDAGNRVRPTAVEFGIWRATPDNGAILQLTHSYGYSETLTGTVEVTGIENAVITGARIKLHTIRIMRPEDTALYRGSERLIGLVDGRLLWRLDTLTSGEQPAAHVSATLTRMDAT
ncbi:MAG: FABP family protein [Candidatus Nanopelagicales bacterium]